MIREGVLREVGARGPGDRVARRARPRARAAWSARSGALVAALPDAKLAPESRPAVASILAQIALEDAQSNLDYVPPSFARRLVRAGWLARCGAPRALTRSCARGARSRGAAADRALRGPRRPLELVEDAYGSRVWTLSTPERVGYSRLAPAPAYYTNGPVTRLVVRLPVGRDPLRDAARWQSAELWDGAGADREPGAPAHGLASDAAAWRRAFPTTGEGVEWAGAGRRAAAAHLLVTAPNGDVLALPPLTAWCARRRAEARPTPSASTAKRRSALPDAAHLDLIGEYLLVYAYDSPDPRNPA